MFTFNVTEYVQGLGRCVEGFNAPLDAKEQFDIIFTNLQYSKNKKLLETLRVKYDGMNDFVKFKPDNDNYHQFNALATFVCISPARNEAIVKAVHSLGGIFEGTFIRSKEKTNQIEYISKTGQKTEFTFNM